MSINKIIDEAVKIKRDYPELKYYEALEKAKEIYTEKEPKRSPAK